MLRLASVGAWFLALAPLACSGPPAPNPTRVNDAVNAIRAPAKPPRDPDSPFRSPDKEPPPPRSGPQQTPEELKATLDHAEDARRIGDEVEVAATLRACANKVPQSVRCEGELGAILAKQPRFRYESDYYLHQAIGADDPALDAAYYRRLGDALAFKGKYSDAATAYQRMIDRSSPATAADYNVLAVALQGVPERVLDAAEALRRAYELDPTRVEWLRERAILLGQVPDKIAQAIPLFEDYKTKVQDPALIAETEQRIAELTALLARPSAPDPAPGAGKKRPKKPRKPRPAAVVP